jgi:hypothetical protein
LGEYKDHEIIFQAGGRKVRSPFNICDYLCERCEETERCEIFALLQSKTSSRQMGGRSDGLRSASLEDVKESLDETMEILKEIAAGLSIDLDYSTELGMLDRSSVDDDALYRLALAFTTKTYAFLKTAEPYLKPGQRALFDDLVWYHRIVSVKTRRAVASDHSGLSEDAIDSAAVAMKALTRCIEAFEHIGQSFFCASDDPRQLSNTAVEIRRQLRKRFAMDRG